MMRDLVKRVLTAAEALPPGSAQELLVEGETIAVGSELEEAAYYCRERSYIELWDSTPQRFGGGSAWLVRRLTALGHDKLRELRGQQPL